jgi:hypothetical protein
MSCPPAKALSSHYRFCVRCLTQPHTVCDVDDPGGEARDDATLVIQSALAGDGDGVVGTFDAVADRRGMGAAYDVAWHLAGEMVGDGIARGPWRLDFPDIDDATYDARWVARFVSAYANDDAPTGTALFTVALVDGRLSECLLTLAGSTVATLRRRRATS